MKAVLEVDNNLLASVEMIQEGEPVEDESPKYIGREWVTLKNGFKKATVLIGEGEHLHSEMVLLEDTTRHGLPIFKNFDKTKRFYFWAALKPDLKRPGKYGLTAGAFDNEPDIVIPDTWRPEAAQSTTSQGLLFSMTSY